MVTEEAWRKAERLGMAPNSAGELVVPMFRRVGWQGGYAGTGQALNSVRLVVKPGTSQVITAYPY